MKPFDFSFATLVVRLTRSAQGQPARRLDALHTGMRTLDARELCQVSGGAPKGSWQSSTTPTGTGG